jgi:hypothetical protein
MNEKGCLQGDVPKKIYVTGGHLDVGNSCELLGTSLSGAESIIALPGRTPGETTDLAPALSPRGSKAGSQRRLPLCSPRAEYLALRDEQ